MKRSRVRVSITAQRNKRVPEHSLVIFFDKRKSRTPRQNHPILRAEPFKKHNILGIMRLQHLSHSVQVQRSCRDEQTGAYSLIRTCKYSVVVSDKWLRFSALSALNREYSF